MKKSIYDPFYRQIIAELKQARLQAGLTQAEVGRRMEMCRTWVGKIEACEIRLDVIQLVRLARIYGWTTADVIGAAEAGHPVRAARDGQLAHDNDLRRRQ